MHELAQSAGLSVSYRQAEHLVLFVEEVVRPILWQQRQETEFITEAHMEDQLAEMREMIDDLETRLTTMEEQKTETTKLIADLSTELRSLQHTIQKIHEIQVQHGQAW